MGGEGWLLGGWVVARWVEGRFFYYLVAVGHGSEVVVVVGRAASGGK